MSAPHRPEPPPTHHEVTRTRSDRVAWGLIDPIPPIGLGAMDFLLAGMDDDGRPPDELASPPDGSRCPVSCMADGHPEPGESLPEPDPPAQGDLIAPLLITNIGTMLDLFA